MSRRLTGSRGADPRLFFFFNDTATTEIYTLSLHDALPISPSTASRPSRRSARRFRGCREIDARSEEHTSELQSRQYLVCRLLLEKTKLRRQIRPPSASRIHIVSARMHARRFPCYCPITPAP